MYASELQKRLVDLQEAETALAEAQGDRPGSGDKFEKVFRSSPSPFTITTLREGRFVDVNAAGASELLSGSPSFVLAQERLGPSN